MSDYHKAQCAAITKNGRRCSGRWNTALVIVFSWDPVKGEGIEGPYCVLCHRHVHFVREKGILTGKRFKIIGGWLAASNQYGYGQTVFSSKNSNRPAKKWWDHRRPSYFGKDHAGDAL